MAEQTSISWCDHTFNHVIGCTKVAPGCKHCYAESFAKRYHKAAWGPQGTRVKTSEAYWRKPLKWNREAGPGGKRRHQVLSHDGHRPRVFCASLADVFEDWQGPVVNSKGERLFWPHNSIDSPRYIPESHCGGGEPRVTMADLRRELFALIDATRHLDWLVLTKRPENVRRMWPASTCQECAGRGPGKCPRCLRNGPDNGWRPNVWLGTSVSDQATADRNVPELLKCRDLCPVLFVSAEPLVGAVDLDKAGAVEWDSVGAGPSGGPSESFSRGLIDWLIVGGESGPNHRPMQLEWAASLRDQCQAAGVPYFFKQLAHRRSGQGADALGEVVQEFPAREDAT